MIKTTTTSELLQTLTPHSLTILFKLKEWIEWAMKLKKVKFKEWNLKLKEWNQTMKEWTTNSYPLR